MQRRSSQTVVCRAGCQVDRRASRCHSPGATAPVRRPVTVVPLVTSTDKCCATGVMWRRSWTRSWTRGSAWTRLSVRKILGRALRLLAWRSRCQLSMRPVVVDVACYVNILHLSWPTSPPYHVKPRCSQLLHNVEMYYLQQTVTTELAHSKLKYGLFGRVISFYDSWAQNCEKLC